MTVSIAINGFGRIGRNVLRAIVESGRDDIKVVAVNDLAPPATNAHLFRYDSVHGRFHGNVQLEDDVMDVGTGPIKVIAEKDLTKLPWGALGVRSRSRVHGGVHQARDGRKASGGGRGQGARSPPRATASTSRWSTA